MQKEAAGEWYEVLSRNLPSGSNEHHKNTSGSVAGLRAGIWTQSLPEYEAEVYLIMKFNSKRYF